MFKISVMFSLLIVSMLVSSSESKPMVSESHQSLEWFALMWSVRNIPNLSFPGHGYTSRNQTEFFDLFSSNQTSLVISRKEDHCRPHLRGSIRACESRAIRPTVADKVVENLKTVYLNMTLTFVVLCSLICLTAKVAACAIKALISYFIFNHSEYLLALMIVATCSVIVQAKESVSLNKRLYSIALISCLLCHLPHWLTAVLLTLHLIKSQWTCEDFHDAIEEMNEAGDTEQRDRSCSFKEGEEEAYKTMRRTVCLLFRPPVYSRVLKSLQ